MTHPAGYELFRYRWPAWASFCYWPFDRPHPPKILPSSSFFFLHSLRDIQRLCQPELEQLYGLTVLTTLIATVSLTLRLSGYFHFRK